MSRHHIGHAAKVGIHLVKELPSLPKPNDPAFAFVAGLVFGALGGADRLTAPGRKPSHPAWKSGNRGRPRARRSGPKRPKCGSADQMPLDVECVVDSRVGGKESLG